MADREELRKRAQEFRGEVRHLDGLPWVECYYVRSISTAERDEIEILSARLDPKSYPESARGYRARVASILLSDEDGRRLFGDDEIDVLEQADGRVVEAIREEGFRLNGYTVEEIEALEGNSGSAENGASCSGSRGISDGLSRSSSESSPRESSPSG